MCQYKHVSMGLNTWLNFIIYTLKFHSKLEAKKNQSLKTKEELVENYAKRKKPSTKGHKLYGSVFMKCPE